MRACLTIAMLFLFAFPAVADEMSLVNCNILSNSAASGALKLRQAIGEVKGEALHEMIPALPESAKDEAKDVEDARIGMESAMREYMISLDAFSKAVKDCGN
ncbi:exported hypothetical protein [Mesorhizobium plurifarium]|uniref:Uncharacterized protein n=1 Tax=Mesorhizobium plurifarium TaxID=69974 RepID=A0A090E9N0_MESPL|nr:exported hypothetical protein [Mesorhizobium plurifarium]